MSRSKIDYNWIELALYDLFYDKIPRSKERDIKSQEQRVEEIELLQQLGLQQLKKIISQDQKTLKQFFETQKQEKLLNYLKQFVDEYLKFRARDQENLKKLDPYQNQSHLQSTAYKDQDKTQYPQQRYDQQSDYLAQTQIIQSKDGHKLIQQQPFEQEDYYNNFYLDDNVSLISSATHQTQLTKRFQDSKNTQQSISQIPHVQNDTSKNTQQSISQISHVQNDSSNTMLSMLSSVNYKNKLQEMFVKYFPDRPQPNYSNWKEGPDHMPKFTAIVKAGEKQFSANGPNRKEAEQNAAEAAFKYWAPQVIQRKRMTPISLVDSNYKGSLQQFAQQQFPNIDLPQYEQLATEGPPHHPIFTYKVEWKDLVCIGRGKSRKDAEMNAAHRMIELINERIALDTLK